MQNSVEEISDLIQFNPVEFQVSAATLKSRGRKRDVVVKALEKAQKEHATVENRVNDLTATAAQSKEALSVLKTSSDAAQMFKLESAAEESSEEADRMNQVRCFS